MAAGPPTGEPLVSVFTAAHAAGAGIGVPAASMVTQEEQRWEWVIVDDSGDSGSHAAIEALASSPEAAGRIRFVRIPATGSIGAAKRAAAGLCAGPVLVELDHDDELLPAALAVVVDAFDLHPELDFVHSDWVDVVEGAGAQAIYEEGWGAGLGSYATEMLGGVRVPVALAPALSWDSVRHITSMPNHLRAWRAAFYERIGGHDPEFPVADDYELLVRTVLAGRAARIPLPLYVQHHARDAASASRTRNAEIQERVAAVATERAAELDARCLEAGSIPGPAAPLSGPEPLADIAFPLRGDALAGAPLVSVVIPTRERPELLRKALASALAQTLEDLEVLVVGDACPDLDEVMADVGDPRVRHVNLATHHDDGGAGPRNVAVKTMARAELIAYLDDDNEWDPEHLASLAELLADPAVAYALSSIEIAGEVVTCRRPRRYLVDTSALLHRRSLLERYGYWVPRGAGAHDWELVSRWHRERWAASLRPTLRYRFDPTRHPPELLEAMRAVAEEGPA